MALITLQADREEVCPSEVVTIEAQTTPPSGNVIWNVDGEQFGMVNGVPTTGEQFDEDGNVILPDGVIAAEGDTIKIRGAGGQTKVIRATHGPPGEQTSLSVTVTWKNAGVKIELDPIPTGSLLITGQPQLQPPLVTAKAIGIGGSVSSVEWQARMGLDNFNDCPPHGPTDLDTMLDLVPSAGGDQVTFDLTDSIRGAGLFISVKAIVNGCVVSASGGAGIGGTNPERSDIQAALPHDTLRQIACKESEQRQFDAPPDGGVAFCPLFGCGGNVGVMQIPSPTAEEVWNWRTNVAQGIEIFGERLATARAYPNQVRNSAGFQQLVGQFNQRRQAQGLAPIEITLPEFASGDFDDDLQQLELDTIRGYNGWFGSDRFGFELHEFRVAVDEINGQELLKVTNIVEQTLKGEAVWERVPVQDRPTDGECNDPDYVNRVMALSPTTCLASLIPPPPSAVIEHTLLMLDDFSRPLEWNKHVIGLDDEARRINIQIDGTGLQASVIPVLVTTRVANRAAGATSVDPALTQVQFDVVKNDAASQATGRDIYRRTLTIAEYNTLPRSLLREVATIVRPGGTSGEAFREKLGWAPRGIGTMPGAIGAPTGDEAEEAPDAFQLLRAGGVEVLEVRILTPPVGVTVLQAQCSRLIRSPADLVYISGHGLYENNCIAIDSGSSQYHCWVNAAGLDKWRDVSLDVAVGDVQGEPEVLIFAGCSILSILRTGGRLRGPGLAWANLLQTKNGPLRAILGYRKGRVDGREGSAPSDSGGGRKIAADMGAIIASGAGNINYVQEWLNINIKHKAIFAVGIDTDGFWWLEKKTLRRWQYEIKGPTRL